MGDVEVLLEVVAVGEVEERPSRRGQFQFDEALAAAEEALRANRRLRNRFAEPVFRDVLCWIHRSRGDHERAIAYGLEVAGSGGLPWIEREARAKLADVRPVRRWATRRLSETLDS